MEDRPILWGYALALWDHVGVWAMIVGAGLGVLALAVSLFSSFVLWRVAGVAQTDLKTKTAGLDAQVETQKRLTAQAGERAAGLEKEAARLRLEQEQLKAQLAWRVIPTATAAALEKALAAHRGAVNLRWMDGDPEALYFAIQFGQILSKAGWQVAPGASKPAGMIIFGILIPDNAARNTDSGRALLKAFAAAEVPHGSGALPRAGVEFNVQQIANAPTLMIGSKAPAELLSLPTS